MRKFLLFMLLMASSTCFAKRIYVNPLAIGNNNGTSWVNAYTKLTAGVELGLAGDTVLVAEAIYDNVSSGSLYSYRIHEGITILGGYPNTGNPTDAQRNWVTHPTILSGDGGTNGTPDNVLLLQNIANAVVIDGFIMKCSRTGGLKIVNAATVLVKNTVFENSWGNAVYINNSQATFINCVLSRNDESPVYNTTNANTAFYNCVIASNYGYSQVIKNENATLAIYNCTLVNNTGLTIMGTGTGSIQIKNSIFWGNLQGNRFENADINSYNHTIVASHSITQTYFDSNINTLLTNQHPRFLNQQQPAGADNKFFTADDGLQLTVPCSPALNYGNNSLLGSITTDIIGNPRIFNAGTVDLGAYEMQQAPGSHLKTVYVNNSAANTGTGDGSTWANAFTSLQQAMLYCADTIKIAAGTYLTPNSYTDSVFSLESGKVLMGGYPATGNPSNADRDPWRYPTILKGNYSKASTGNYSPVLKIYRTDSTTLLDGIKFTNWASSDNSSNVHAVSVRYGASLTIMNCDFRVDASQGIRVTGLAIGEACTPYVYRCEFNTGFSEAGGTAVGCGGNSNTVFAWCNFRAYGVASDGISLNNSSATFDSCLFWKDISNADAVFMSTYATVLTLNNCIFRAYNNRVPLLRNTANTTGLVTNSIFRNIQTDGSTPAIYNDNSHLVFNKCLFDSSKLVMRNLNQSAPVINNCLSVHGRFMWNKRSTPLVNNCTVVNTYFAPNSPLDITAREELVTNDDSSVFRANNTIFWPAKLNPGEKDIADQQNIFNPPANSSSILTNCLTQNYGTHGQNGNIVGKVPRFNRLDYILGPDGRLFTADDGLQLAVCSPAVNTGNSALGTILATDVLNNQRIANAVIDMGAYELQHSASNTGSYYVNSAASGNNTGASWNDAYPDLQAALCNACADTIRVAAGTYKPAVSKRDSSFVISHPLALYGGYPATGNPTEANRDAVKHPTILSGNIGDVTDSLDNSGLIVFVNAVTDSVHIDGFEIRDGYNSGGIAVNAAGGAGMCVLYSNTGIYNCRFINNRSSPYGGGVSITSLSRTTVSGCTFTRNSSTNEGGALYSKGYLHLTGSVFENNYSYSNGGAIGVNAGCDISNSVFYKNYTTATNANGIGGGLFIGSTAGYANVTNCSFVENKATSTNAPDMAGGGLYYDGLHAARFKNCIFNGNLAGNYTNNSGADINYKGYSIASNCILQYSRGPLTNDSLIAVDPGFLAVNDPKGPDGIWLTKDDGLQLHYASAAINYGQNAAVQNIPVDILGDARIALNKVDLGAYEYQNTPVARAGADTSICTGDTVTIGRDGNPNHIYNWTSSPAGFTSSSPAPVVNPAASTTYFIEVTNGTQIVRDTVEVSISSSLTPAVNVITGSTSVCAGAAVFTAVPLYGGADPAYQWLVNGVNAGTDTSVFSTNVQQGDQVSVRLTSSASCASPATATSNVITMNVTPVAVPQVTINGPLVFCEGDTVTYTATPVDGGTRPLYKWIKGGVLAATTYNNSYTTAFITSQTDIYVMMFSNAVCQTKGGDTSNVLRAMPKSIITPSVAVSASNTNICGTPQVTFTAQGYGGGTTPLWQWKVNGNNVGTNSNIYRSNSMADGDQVYVAMTSNADCARPPVAESNKVTMIVDRAIIPTISITAPTEVPQDTIITVTASLVNGHGVTSYLWQDSTATHNWQTITGAVTRTVNYTPKKTGDKIRCVAQTATNCGDAVTAQSEPVTFKVNTVTGIDPVPAAYYGISSWPNPVNTYLIIDGLRLSDQWQMLEISGVEGRQKIQVQSIAAQKQVTLHTASLKAGLYIVILKKKNGEMVYIKFVKL
ncbi:T9SS type A sorting domain-containing protein [Niastella caeni]|uniref:T9SS type A sorting domain-containing protein n=1 Tax=Niastella caeni TaxID=2569763 RepID=A0A4V4H029_9BACT|nr:choice-of-anchor Q domain-containing protein [Niastella caeni]THU34956.1 T9SS type A sorting domain-containing protein [Niastella caeni]